MKFIKLIKSNSEFSNLYKTMQNALENNKLKMVNFGSFYHEIEAITESDSEKHYVKIKASGEDYNYENNKNFLQDGKIKVSFQVLPPTIIVPKEIDFFTTEINFKKNNFNGLARLLSKKAYKFLNNYQKYVKENNLKTNHLGGDWDNPDFHGGYIWD